MIEAIVKINKTKSWFFEKINKIDKPLARLIKKKERRIKSTKLEMKNEKKRGYHRQCTNTRIIRDYSEQLHGNKMDKLEEMARFLEKFHLPRLSQEETEIMNSQLQALKLKL